MELAALFALLRKEKASLDVERLPAAGVCLPHSPSPDALVLPFAHGEHAGAIRAAAADHWVDVLHYFGWGPDVPHGAECAECHATFWTADRHYINRVCASNRCPFFRGGEDKLGRSTCRSCGAPVMWATTESGKRIPLNVWPADNGNLVINHDGLAVAPSKGPRRAARYTTHFTNCPNAGRHRTPE